MSDIKFSIACFSNEWDNTLPVITKPFPGESLYGFLLRLDIINMFSPGTVMDTVKKHTTGRLSLNKPGLFVVGTIFDFTKLSELANLPITEIEKLTLYPTLKRFFKSNEIYSELAGSYPNFKVCPICIKDYKLPLIHIFKNINTCFEHKVFLHDKCICGEKIRLFTSQTRPCCPNCGTEYSSLPIRNFDSDENIFFKDEFYYNSYKSIIFDKIDLIHEDEVIASGLEKRLQYWAFKGRIPSREFKIRFGYDVTNIKNGHGMYNISLSKIIDVLYRMGVMPWEFRDMNIDKDCSRIIDQTSYVNISEGEHVCPNIYCEYYGVQGKGNVKFYGRKKDRYGNKMIEEFCDACGTRFFGNNIIQSYDYNPGLRKIDIDKARERIITWQKSLIVACKEMIEKRIPITLTGCFKHAKIPIGKTYFIDRLGLISILEKYAQEQRNELKTWSHGLEIDDLEDFTNRIYRRRKGTVTI